MSGRIGELCQDSGTIDASNPKGSSWSYTNPFTIPSWISLLGYSREMTKVTLNTTDRFQARFKQGLLGQAHKRTGTKI